MAENRHQAIFLDRDGTIIKDKGYIADKKDVKFYPFAFKALKLLQERFKLFIVTNQSGVAKGIISVGDVEAINEYVNSRLKENGIKIEDIYYCPHKNEDLCKCKKPKTYFFDLAVKNHGIIAKDSFVIGDHPSDILFAKNADANGIFLLTGHGRSHIKEIDTNTMVCKNLYFAAIRILKEFSDFNRS